MTSHIARQDCCTSHCPFGRAMAASRPDKSVALDSVCYCSAPGFYSLRSSASFVIIGECVLRADRAALPITMYLAASAIALDATRTDLPKRLNLSDARARRTRCAVANFRDLRLVRSVFCFWRNDVRSDYRFTAVSWYRTRFVMAT